MVWVKSFQWRINVLDKGLLMKRWDLQLLMNENKTINEWDYGDERMRLQPWMKKIVAKDGFNYSYEWMRLQLMFMTTDMI